MSIADGRIETPHGVVTCALDQAEGGTLMVCAHGAGGSHTDRGTLAASRALQPAGLSVLRFNAPYRERRSGRPDPMPILMEVIAGVAEQARRERRPNRIIIGGRSMGGRAASMLAAGGFACDGLLLLAYPLHPPGRPDALRDGHFPAIRVPVLCMNGTRDAFCTPELMKRATGSLPSWTMHWLDGADHGFRVLKRSGRTDADVMNEVTHVTTKWLHNL